MASPGKNFEDYVHIPLLLLMLVLLWAMILVRVRNVKSTTAGRYSLRVVAAFFIILAGAFCTIYFVLICTVYILAHKVTALHGGPLFGANYPVIDPKTFTGNQVAEITSLIIRSQWVCVGSRFVLVLGLWTVKIAFICIFLEVLEFLGKKTKIMVQATAAFILITLLIGLWALAKDFAVTMVMAIPPPDLIRSGAARGGVAFVSGNADVEFLLTVFNIMTDLLLLVISFQVYKALRFPLSAGVVVFVMVSITVLIATIRLVLVGLLFSGSELMLSIMYNLNLALSFLSECETIVAAIVSCLPGLRAYMRSRDENGPPYSGNERNAGGDEMGNLRFYNERQGTMSLTSLKTGNNCKETYI